MKRLPKIILSLFLLSSTIVNAQENPYKAIFDQYKSYNLVIEKGESALTENQILELRGTLFNIFQSNGLKINPKYDNSAPTISLSVVKKKVPLSIWDGGGTQSYYFAFFSFVHPMLLPGSTQGVPVSLKVDFKMFTTPDIGQDKERFNVAFKEACLALISDFMKSYNEM